MADGQPAHRIRYVEEFDKVRCAAATYRAAAQPLTTCALQARKGGGETAGYGLQSYDSVLGNARTALEKSKKTVYCKPRQVESRSLIRTNDKIDAEALGEGGRRAAKALRYVPLTPLQH